MTFRLSKSRKGEGNNKKRKKKTAHKPLLGKRMSVAGEAARFTFALSS
jgi:hypothetical protein